jgi:hypothetical protein
MLHATHTAVVAARKMIKASAVALLWGDEKEVF